MGHGRQLRRHARRAARRTSCRARIRSTPGSKISTTDERPSTDFERMVLSQAVPFRRVLQGHGDQALDLGGGKAGGLGLDLHQRRRELGEHVDRRVAHGPKPGHDQKGGEARHRHPQVERPGDQPANHFPVPNSVPKISMAPTLTTLAPGAGPLARMARPSAT